MSTLRNDADIRQEVLDSLQRSRQIDANAVGVQVQSGTVRLTGHVPEQRQRQLAEDLVRSVTGVRHVDNLLQVQATPVTDEQIADQVRAAMARTLGLVARRIHVEVQGGVVTLSGGVGSHLTKSAAEDIASSVAGVASVVNELVVETAVNRTDDEITNEVLADLARNLRLGPGRIQVDVYGGVVYLRGTVDTQEQKWLAEEIAWWPAGVRAVVNELQVTARGPGGGQT
jgi:osmotically-inducible protein OsmY